MPYLVYGKNIWWHNQWRRLKLIKWKKELEALAWKPKVRKWTILNEFLHSKNIEHHNIIIHLAYTPTNFYIINPVCSNPSSLFKISNSFIGNSYYQWTFNKSNMSLRDLWSNLSTCSNLAYASTTVSLNRPTLSFGLILEKQQRRTIKIAGG